MKYFKDLRVLLLFTLLSYSGFSQQDAQFTQYMYNTSAINAAYTGSRGHLTLNTLYRTQWVGIEGAPKTITFGINGPIKLKNVGLGFSAFADQEGPATESNFALDVSYTIRTSEKTKLAFGIKGGLGLINIDFNKLDALNPTDPNLIAELDNKISPIFGIGFYLYSDKWYLGASTPNVLKTRHFTEKITSNASEKIHYTLMGGYVFDINATTKFKPAFLATAIPGAPLSMSLSGNFMFNQKFTLGVAYRYNAAVSALAGFQINKQLMLGYAYDYDTTDIGDFNSGSHEFFLQFDFLSNKRTTNVVTPRFF